MSYLLQRHSIAIFFAYVAIIQLFAITFGSAIEPPLWYALTCSILVISTLGFNYSKMPSLVLLFVIYVAIVGVLRSYTMGLDQVLGTVLFLGAFSTFFWISSNRFFKSYTRLRPRFDFSVVQNVADLIIISCFLQLLIFYVFSVSFYGDAINVRGSGINAQITGIFKEPALLTTVCSSLLVYFLYSKNYMGGSKERYIRVVLLVLVILLSKSLGGLLLLVTIIVPHMLSLGLKRILIILVAIILIFLLGDAQFSRVRNELLPVFDSLGSDTTYGFTNSSSFRLAGELYFFQETLRESPFFGFGIDYNYIGGYFRNSSLNVLTEIVIRWGIIGLVLFIGMIVQLTSALQGYLSKATFLLFAFALFFVDAAIAKPVFWIVLGLGYCSFLRVKTND